MEAIRKEGGATLVGVEVFDRYEGEGLAADGVVTDEGLAKLRERLPFADIDSFASDPQVENIQDLFTVDMLVKFVAAKQAADE